MKTATSDRSEATRKLVSDIAKKLTRGRYFLHLVHPDPKIGTTHLSRPIAIAIGEFLAQAETKSADDGLDLIDDLRREVNAHDHAMRIALEDTRSHFPGAAKHFEVVYEARLSARLNGDE